MSILDPGDLIKPVSDLIGKVVDRVWPDKTAQAAERARAELAMMQLTQEGDFKIAAQQMSAILAEAQSADPWTSRARPSFLYVIYLLILFAVPMGFVAAWKPELAVAVATGMKAWLDAIPESLYTLFGVGYLGYTGARGWEKVRGVAK